jgi:phenylpropionate dioxygenase-like ring-hydroxylating dioxygenase large terminal subunit
MLNSYDARSIAALIEPDRIHRAVYTDPTVFALEMERIWSRAWLYLGHESQIPGTGDYFTTDLARRPVVVVRHEDGSIRAFHNQCAHKGAEVVTAREGNVRFFYCNYHGWTYRTDGALANLPLRDGYKNTCLSFDNPDFGLQPVKRLAAYRGFLFGSLAADGPDLMEFLGPAKVAFDDLCDRSPEGEVEVYRTCARTVQHSNWKFFLENQLDVVHAGIVHLSSTNAGKQVARKYFAEGAPQPMPLLMLQAQTPPDPGSVWDKLVSRNFRYGHAYFGGYLPERNPDPVTQRYEAMMREKLGPERTDEILARSIHHTLIYPCLSIQSAFQQIRVMRPVAPDRTIMEIWHFKLKGVADEFLRRNMNYSNIVNSPASIIACDDYETWWRCQQGLGAQGTDWVSVHRDLGGETTNPDGVVESNYGASEVFQRAQYAAWLEYMQVEA